MGNKALKKINNLKLVIREIRAYLAGNATGITRDEKIVHNLMLLVFCKIYDESNNINGNLLFKIYDNDSDIDIKNRIEKLFDMVKQNFPDIFTEKEKLTLVPKDLKYVVKKMQSFSFMQTERDVVADVFEELIGVAYRGGEGQFFTPKNVVKAMVEILKPKSGEKIIDPACGSAGFLVYSYLFCNKNNINNVEFYGIEKDSFLAKISKMYLSVLGLKSSNICCDNSLVNQKDWLNKTRSTIKLNSFDCVITNPPFGAKIPITDPDILSSYKLGHVWKNNNGSWEMTNKLFDKQPPQILFIERIVDLLKIGGRAGIVLPDGIFGNASSRYIWEYLRQECTINAVISLSQEAFQPSTHTKTSILFITKNKKSSCADNNIFMSIVDSVGHDKNGKELYKYNLDGSLKLDENGSKILDDELPELINRINLFKNNKLKNDKLSFIVNSKNIKNNVYVPSSYLIQNEFENNDQYKYISIKELIQNKIITIKRGNEIGSKFYGTGLIPFIRTSDIVNWEIKVDPIKCVSEEAYNLYKEKQNIKQGDILFVNDGTFLIGRSAMISKINTKIIIQSHLRKITVLDKNFIDPYYLFYLLNTDFVQKQVKAKIFTQATLSTLGNRLEEIILPISLNKEEVKIITQKVKSIFKRKNEIAEDVLLLQKRIK